MRSVVPGRPIFIVSAGRSGSTVLHCQLARHPQVAWMSELVDKYPERPWLNRALLAGIDVPLLERKILQRFGPVECYRFWDHHYRGFSAPCRDLHAEDVTPPARRSLTEVFSQLHTPRRRRLLFKITGWPRIGFLKEIFPDARFIHVLRDGRAAAASLLRVPWWEGWRWGPLTDADGQEWEAHGRSFVALAGFQWRLLMAAFREAEKAMPSEDVLHVRYEEMCAESLRVFEEIMTFADLPWTPEFHNTVRRRPFENRNEPWRKDLTEAQQQTLQAVLEDELARQGYV